ncbi:unnamed protein product [Adineta steineri]|uniref:RING-type domain-containing protein n=1 Tax=Adineta steineri TaxID=433720 RepID=A0A814QHY6_9BILA|nr:unnamed protein product [Adineta steineri]CAF1459109.1 unnamed protein product [Adineta steineri]
MSIDYEYLNESSIDDNLKCAICNDPFEKPYVTSCDHTFCYTCILQQIQINKSCPLCRSSIENINNIMPVKTRLILNMLDSLLVKCKFCEKKRIERGSFEDHLKICRKQMNCLCTAADIRCPWNGRRDQLSFHVQQCPYEQIRPVLSEILTRNRYLEQQISSPKVNHNENQQLKVEINQLYQRCQQLENELHQYKIKSVSIQNNSTTSSNNRPITFESLLTENKFGSIQDGYAGLNWINVRYTNEENARLINSQKNYDRLSVFSRGYTSIIHNDGKNPMVISSSIKQTFILYACEIMSINSSDDICQLNIIGRREKKVIYSKIVSLKYNISKVIEFPSWINLNEIEFSISKKLYFILTWIQLKYE